MAATPTSVARHTPAIVEECRLADALMLARYSTSTGRFARPDHTTDAMLAGAELMEEVLAGTDVGGRRVAQRWIDAHAPGQAARVIRRLVLTDRVRLTRTASGARRLLENQHRLTDPAAHADLRDALADALDAAEGPRGARLAAVFVLLVAGGALDGAMRDPPRGRWRTRGPRLSREQRERAQRIAAGDEPSGLAPLLASPSGLPGPAGIVVEATARSARGVRDAGQVR